MVFNINHSNIIFDLSPIVMEIKTKTKTKKIKTKTKTRT